MKLQPLKRINEEKDGEGKDRGGVADTDSFTES